MNQTRGEYSVHPIGYIRSTLRALDEAPRQVSEGAPDAWLEVNPSFARGLLGIAAGDEVIVITWLHRADRDVLEVHPRGDPEIPLAGVFATRSPHRPNPLGLHRVTVREISGSRLRIGPIEDRKSTRLNSSPTEIYTFPYTTLFRSAGVFATRSPHRPNPLGLHRVTVREISGSRLRIGPI